MDTVRDTVEEIARLVCEAETRALFGECMTALITIQKADELYMRFEAFISPFEDTDWLAPRIASIIRNLCVEATNSGNQEHINGRS